MRLVEEVVMHPQSSVKGEGSFTAIALIADFRAPSAVLRTFRFLESSCLTDALTPSAVMLRVMKCT